MLNFIAILQLYKISKITLASFFDTQCSKSYVVCRMAPFSITLNDP